MKLPHQNAAIKIAKYIKYQREKRDWSLSDFASRSDLTPSFLSRLEQGDYNTVKYDVIQKLAAGFSLSVRVFLWKCELIEREEHLELPDFEFYLKEKFQLPSEAIEDMNLFLELIHKKYRKEIEEMKKAHEEYWKEKAK